MNISQQKRAQIIPAGNSPFPAGFSHSQLGFTITARNAQIYINFPAGIMQGGFTISGGSQTGTTRMRSSQGGYASSLGRNAEAPWAPTWAQPLVYIAYKFATVHRPRRPRGPNIRPEPWAPTWAITCAQQMLQIRQGKQSSSAPAPTWAQQMLHTSRRDIIIPAP